MSVLQQCINMLRLCSRHSRGHWRTAKLPCLLSMLVKVLLYFTATSPQAGTRNITSNFSSPVKRQSK
jgi:hypothetical protein